LDVRQFVTNQTFKRINAFTISLKATL